MENKSEREREDEIERRGQDKTVGRRDSEEEKARRKLIENR